jgi:hypothetical protein
MKTFVNSRPARLWFSAKFFGDVSDDVLDGPNLIAFVTVDLWVAALVDYGTKFFRPLAGRLKRPHRALANSDETLTTVNTINENK